MVASGTGANSNKPTSTIVLDYAFYVTYTLIVFQIVILVLSFRELRRRNEARVGRLFLAQKIVYPTVILLGGLFYLSYYGVITLPSFQSEQAVTTEFASLQTPDNVGVQPIIEQAASPDLREPIFKPSFAGNELHQPIAPFPI